MTGPGQTRVRRLHPIARMRQPLCCSLMPVAHDSTNTKRRSAQLPPLLYEATHPAKPHDCHSTGAAKVGTKLRRRRWRRRRWRCAAGVTARAGNRWPTLDIRGTVLTHAWPTAQEWRRRANPTTEADPPDADARGQLATVDAGPCDADASGQPATTDADPPDANASGQPATADVDSPNAHVNGQPATTDADSSNADASGQLEATDADPPDADASGQPTTTDVNSLDADASGQTTTDGAESPDANASGQLAATVRRSGCGRAAAGVAAAGVAAAGCRCIAPRRRAPRRGTPASLRRRSARSCRAAGIALKSVEPTN